MGHKYTDPCCQVSLTEQMRGGLRKEMRTAAGWRKGKGKGHLSAEAETEKCPYTAQDMVLCGAIQGNGGYTLNPESGGGKGEARDRGKDRQTDHEG